MGKSNIEKALQGVNGLNISDFLSCFKDSKPRDGHPRRSMDGTEKPA
jgi:hypothetical protein